MQIRELTALSKEELIELVLRERKETEAVGAGGVSLMGDAKGAEIEKLRALIRKIMRWDIDRAVENGFIPLAIPIEIRAEITAALTQQEQA